MVSDHSGRYSSVVVESVVDCNSKRGAARLNRRKKEEEVVREGGNFERCCVAFRVGRVDSYPVEVS